MQYTKHLTAGLLDAIAYVISLHASGNFCPLLIFFANKMSGLIWIQTVTP